jgi:hypothetical protein
MSPAPAFGCGSRKETLGAVSRPDLTLSISAGHRFLILFQRAWHEVLELVDTSRIGRVSGHQFRRLLAVLCFHHPLPKRYRFTRIVAGPRHILQADLISFKFVLPAEGQ